MALTTMYAGMNNSPQTDLGAAISASDTTILVSDISVFPTAPNLATIGNDENAEVIRYNGISDSTLTGCERGFGGTVASAWETGTVISRQITKYDMDTIKSNIESLESGKQDNLTFDDSPTANSNNPVKSDGIFTALAGKADNGIVADEFATDKAYAFGEHVIHEGVLYRYTSPHSAGAWNSAEVTAVTAAEEIESLESDLSSLNDEVDSIIQESVFDVVLEDNQYVLYWVGAAGSCPYSVTHEGTDYVLYFDYTY